ncbi:hypothetical protein HHL21_11965 [Massilia sp. RP-1-19]|uniref:MASE1 domain-containing protein n=1 Tax=Massilia polaris TaxID=2728846 RepID=A0A848HR64_9BURK|nr:hypothetical protein [Massilia polaris]NML61783.1 hypothetical protein [Massilia polaris]
MSQARLNLCMAAATVVLFCSALFVNELLFTKLEFVPGINWIYLPAGMRLLCILLFAEAGAVGLLLVSWGVCFLYFFPDDVLRSFVGGIVATAAPYLVYRAAGWLAGARTSLADLTPTRLLAYAVAFSIASPLLHHFWFALRGQDNLLWGFLAMAAGDLAGTLIVLYSAKYLLTMLSPRPATQHP